MRTGFVCKGPEQPLSTGCDDRPESMRDYDDAGGFPRYVVSDSWRRRAGAPLSSYRSLPLLLQAVALQR